MSSLSRPATPSAPLTVLATLLANGIAPSLAHSLFPVMRTFSHPMVGAVALTTVGAVGAACPVFAVVARLARRPTWLYRRIAVVALVVTMIPDVALLARSDPHYSTAGIVGLMVMHVVDAALCVGVLTTLPRIDPSHGGLRRDERVAAQGGA